MLNIFILDAMLWKYKKSTFSATAVRQHVIGAFLSTFYTISYIIKSSK